MHGCTIARLLQGGGCHYSTELLPLHAHVADNCAGQDIIQMSSMYNYVAACEGRPVTASHCLCWCLQEMQLNPANMSMRASVYRTNC